MYGSDVCSGGFELKVPLRNGVRKGKMKVAVKSSGAGVPNGRDKLKFKCLP